ncbi:S1C family serine protease [Azospirillum agricola]|uniref:S1C family serine protease n=1 Tax=Azospirillum agricola TaxID=1720247 RepID=UPI0011777BB0|nr:S1C family serine protease [Azospirillum agricola]
MRRLAPALLPALVAPLLGGCLASAPQPRPTLAPPVAAGTTEPLRFAELSIGSMRRGTEIGRYVWGIDCAPPYDTVYWTSGANMRRGSTFDERFDEVMAAAGFDVVGRQGGPDAPGATRNRARFTVQGDLRDVRLELCHRSNWLTGADKGSSGSGSARVDWTVYDARNGRLVHRVSTTGTSRQDGGVPQGDTLLVEEAFASAAERLAADGGFRAVLTRGGSPAGGHSPVPGGASAAGLPPLDAPRIDTALIIRTPAADGGGAEDPTARAGAAQVRAGEGYGLVIGEVPGETGRDSLLLVPGVGLGDGVTVRPARGVTLDGRVEGRDAASGLALVRVPARLTAVPVRGGTVEVSEPVSVAMRRGAVSAAGIVGAVRPDPVRGIAVIQADLGSVALFGAPVAAGDPLIDEAGAVVGVALGPQAMSAATPPGLVAFLPVGPLLARMGADLLDASPAPLRRSRTAAELRQPDRDGRGSRLRRAGRDGAFDEEPDGEGDGELDEAGDPPT